MKTTATTSIGATDNIAFRLYEFCAYANGILVQSKQIGCKNRGDAEMQAERLATFWANNTGYFVLVGFEDITDTVFND